MKLLFCIISTVFASLCSTQWNCSGCTQLAVFGMPCRWCPVDGKCHNPGDFFFSKCSSEQQVTEPGSCSHNEPTMKPCPAIWSEQLPAGWQAYPGDSFFFHCGFRGMIEENRAGMVNECFYDETGSVQPSFSCFFQFLDFSIPRESFPLPFFPVFTPISVLAAKVISVLPLSPI